jgi:thimet oligopeptidase
MRKFFAFTLLAMASSAGFANPYGGQALMPVPKNAQAMKALCASSLKAANAQVKKLERTLPASFLAEWNKLDAATQMADAPASLIANVFTDKATRVAAEACSTQLTAFGAKVFQNEKLFKALSAAQAADAVDTQLKKLLTEGFEDTGVTLAPAQRKRMKAIIDEIEQLRQSFDRNVREDATTVTMTADEVKGMSDAWIKGLKKNARGDFIVGLSYPTYVPYMQQGANEEARKRLWMAKQSEGGQKNIDLLQQIAQLRKEMASLFAQPSYAQYVARRRMVGSEDTATTFLADVKTRVQALERTEVDELRQAKAEHVAKPLAEVTINRWDTQFYSERLRKARYSIDQEALRKNFPLEASLDFTFKISADLYGVKFVKASAPTWHKDVRYYEMRDEKTNDFIGGIYLDLFPRADKYNHAAAWGVRGTSTALNRKPFSTLVTNFDRNGLTHDELETLLHEFGHVLHGVLSTAKYLSLAGTNVKLDFVEAPSQMLEEWARRPETLALFKDVCASCPLLSNDDIARLEKARKFGQGIRYARQHLYAAYDMALHGAKVQDPLALWAQMEGDTPLGHVKGTMFPAGFGHLAGGYGAGYYSYMWSEVLALDMLSAFKGQLMDKAVGRKYRDTILASGGQREPMVLVKELLGREPNREAFFAEISGKR